MPTIITIIVGIVVLRLYLTLYHLSKAININNRQKKTNPKARFFIHLALIVYKHELDSNDVMCLWAFLALSYSELNFLAFSQSFET